jgi:hypothetical protein
LNLGSARDGANTGKLAGDEKIDINKLVKQEDLSWMRRRIIERCTEIIKKLAA